jgi:hypothetical protein
MLFAHPPPPPPPPTEFLKKKQRLHKKEALSARLDLIGVEKICVHFQPFCGRRNYISMDSEMFSFLEKSGTNSERVTVLWGGDSHVLCHTARSWKLQTEPRQHI